MYCHAHIDRLRVALACMFPSANANQLEIEAAACAASAAESSAVESENRLASTQKLLKVLILLVCRAHCRETVCRSLKPILMQNRGMQRRRNTLLLYVISFHARFPFFARSLLSCKHHPCHSDFAILPGPGEGFFAFRRGRSGRVAVADRRQPRHISAGF